MGYPVTYHCPRCGTIVEVHRDGYLADKAVTPYPLEGWSYVDPESSFDDADGVRFVCGRSEGVSWRTAPIDPREDPDPPSRSPNETGRNDAATTPDDGASGCGEAFYLSFVRFENGEEIDPRGPRETVELAADVPSSPRGPPGPGEPGSGFYR